MQVENWRYKTLQMTFKASLASSLGRVPDAQLIQGVMCDPGASLAFCLYKQAPLTAGTHKHAKCVFIFLCNIV